MGPLHMFKTMISTLLLVSATAASAGNRTSLLETLAANPDFTTLVESLEAAGLTETLEGNGPFTIYAPTNAAFAAMPEGTLSVLQLPENVDRLAEVLQYHVDDRKLTSRHLVQGAAYYRPLLSDHSLCVINGEQITINDDNGTPARVTEADIRVSNGVIHVIDKVLVPALRPDCA